MKQRIIINPNNYQKQYCLNSLVKKSMQNVLGAEQMAQPGLYCEPAWNRINSPFIS